MRSTFASRALVALLVAAGTLGAQPAARSIGTIVVAHGGDSSWNALVIDAARAARTGGPVEVSFLMGPAAKTTRFQDVASRLQDGGVGSIAVVPLLVSSHSGHYDQIRYLAGDSVRLNERMMHHLHMAGIERPTLRIPLRVAPALDDAPQVARVLLERARTLAPNPSERAVFIVGHGPNSAEDYAAWMTNLRAVADSVKRWGGFRDVRVDLVRDDAPAPVRAEAVLRVRELIELQHLVTRQPVVVVPVLISKGAISRDKLPNDLRGLPITYAGEPLLPHAEISRWIELRARETAIVP
ncbi:MAG: sirohydrochlorin chelatase [Gemmatimonadaceae bacterium]